MTERRDEGGLEYLVKAGKLRSIGDQDQQQQQQQQQVDPSSSQSPVVEPNVDRSLQAFGARVVLTTINEIQAGRGEGTGVRLSEVADRVAMAGDVLIPLARLLESAGAISVIEADAFGNNLVTLTDEGTRLLAPEAAADLMRLFNPS